MRCVSGQLIIRNKIRNVLLDKKITQRELSQMTGIRESTISEIVRGTKTVINFEHIGKIATALNITDIRELFEIVKDEEEIYNVLFR